MRSTATIAACATAPGRGALAVVRFSGTDLASLFGIVVPMNPGPWRSGRIRRVALWDDELFDDGLAVWTEGPRTYTGETTLEVSLHGNPLLVERLLAAVVAAGVRLATPGEFTRRAVQNGRIDLLAAEGVDQIVRATTPEGVRIARAGLSGTLSETVEAVRTRLVELAAELEARLDHPGEDLGVEDDAAVLEGLAQLGSRCAALADSHRVGRIVLDGARVALVGPVNAGKSSLFNALLGTQRALVHDQAGTTRDVVEARTRIGALDVTLLDTAGERQTDDPVEAAGLALAQELVADADLWIVVCRAGDPSAAERLVLERAEGRPHRVVYNGIDRAASPEGTVGVSALVGTGVDALRVEIETALVGAERPDAMIASLRQAEHLRTVASACASAATALEIAGVAVAADQLVEGLEAIDAMTGADTREDVLDAMFARFCIGK